MYLEFKSFNTTKFMNISEVIANQIIISLLGIPTESRTDRQIDSIAYFFNQYSFFKSLTDNSVDKLLYSNITIVELAADEVLFRYGEQASAFYFVISGVVDMFVPAKGASAIMMSDIDGKRIPYKKVKSVGPGGTFGELAMIAQHSRAATIKAAENCVLAMCNRSTYFKCINEKESGKLVSLTEAVNSLLPFKIEKSRLMKLIYLFDPIELGFDFEIYREDKSFTHLYLVMEGEVMVRSKVAEELRDGYIQGIR